MERIPDLNPDMAELRRRLSDCGIEYEVDDYYREFDAGLQLHMESTLVRGMRVIYTWMRDEDGQKRFDSKAGAFGYLELQREDGSSEAVTVDEAMGAIC